MAICSSYTHTDVVNATDFIEYSWWGRTFKRYLCDHHASELVISSWTANDLEITQRYKLQPLD